MSNREWSGFSQDLTEIEKQRRRNMLVKVHVIPNSRQTSVITTGENALDVRVDQPAVDGRANKRLLEILSEYYKTPKSSITIVRGAKSRDKTVNVALENPKKR